MSGSTGDSKRKLLIGVAFAAAAVAGVSARLLIWPPAPAPSMEQAAESESPTAVAVTEELVLESADLYFPSGRGGLRLHQQPLVAGEPLQRIRTLVQASESRQRGGNHCRGH